MVRDSEVTCRAYFRYNALNWLSKLFYAMILLLGLPKCVTSSGERSATRLQIPAKLLTLHDNCVC